MNKSQRLDQIVNSVNKLLTDTSKPFKRRLSEKKTHCMKCKNILSECDCPDETNDYDL